jgi:glycosyltransferase involved in cell wall biosynthesis
MATLKASVLVRAYNQESYIAQALQSALMQRTLFDFEIVIGENASTDGTAAIVRQFQEAHPDRIRAMFRTRNIGPAANFRETFQSCRAPFVAYLDGDDYWTSPDKLQKQVDFLERRPDCGICFTNAYVWTPEQGQTTELMCANPDDRTEFGLDDLAAENFMPMCAVLVRRALVDDWPPWFDELSATDDWVLSLHIARHTGIGFLPEAAVVYRCLPGGVWSGSAPAAKCQHQMQVWDRMADIVGPRHGAIAIARAKANAARIWQANEWFKEQAGNYREELERTQKAYKECRAWMEELERAKRWLEAQVVHYQNEAEGLRNEAKGLRSEAEVLHVRLRCIENSRAWRLACVAREGFNRLWRRPIRLMRAALSSPPK